MLYGLYQSAQGATVQARRLETTAHNLANADTTAFKPDITVVRTVPHFEQRLAFEQQLGQVFDRLAQRRLADDRGLENHNGATAVADVVTDFSNGSVRQTGNTFDVAIVGPGFFRVGGAGESYLTRNGSFVVGPEGVLRMADTGLPVLDTASKPIVLPLDATDVGIGADGLVTDRLATIANIDVVEAADESQLKKLGNSLYASDVELRDTDPNRTRLVQGHLEASGVEPMAEMTAMIEVTRAFEMNMTMVQTQDQSLGRLLQMAAA